MQVAGPWEDEPVQSQVAEGVSRVRPVSQRQGKQEVRQVSKHEKEQEVRHDREKKQEQEQEVRQVSNQEYEQEQEVREVKKQLLVLLELSSPSEKPCRVTGRRSFVAAKEAGKLSITDQTNWGR